MNKIKKVCLTENDIINQYLSKLNFKKKESFNFKNDGALLLNKQGKQIIVTNDSIVESIDFFKDDQPESIAQKIVTYNLSDLSAMGAKPYSYTLSLLISHKVDKIWIKKFKNKLLFFQKKYNFFLLGGDIGKSNQINISANFFGYINHNSYIKREFPMLGDIIWATGNIGESFIGLLILTNKLKVESKIKKYFLNKYFFPKPCLLGEEISNFVNCAIDISDGFLGDLSKLLNNSLGAELNSSAFPFSINAKKLINTKAINSFSLLKSGDDYELIFTTTNQNESKILNIFKRNNYKISKVGRIIEKKGIFIDKKKLLKSNISYQYIF